MFWVVGMMGCGKTSAGKRTATQMNIPFFDTDAMVAEMTGKSIEEIFADGGEPLFRQLEARVVALVPASSGVAAAGGGAVMNDASAATIASASSTVWLQCDPAVAATRLAGGPKRPMLDGDKSQALTGLLGQRRDRYAEVSHFTIDTSSMSVDQVTANLVELWTA